MIPVRLAMRNFMPYRGSVPPLDFTGIHTASICGDNGSGKSALIDAMTWALWGKSRAKNSDELIHLGERETEVEFDFAVGRERYRVIRKYAKPKTRRASGRTILELQIATENGFRSIAGNSVTQTQQEIIKVLHMDYSTFINSAFLRQGKADEFTIATPVERKQVLANILGLSFYDELEEKAKELAKQQAGEKTQAESIIKEIDSELVHKPTYEVELVQARSGLAGIEKVLKEQESRLSELRWEKERLKSKQEQLAQLEKHIMETVRLRDYWDEQIKQHHLRIKEYDELIAQRTVIEENYAHFLEAKRLNEELNQRLRLANTLNERKHQLEMAVIQSSQTLVKEHALAESRIIELEARAQKLPRLRDELQQIPFQLGRLAKEEETLNQRKQKGQEIRVYIGELESTTARWEQEIKEIAEKLNLLLAESGAKCPLCETLLGVDGLRLVEAKYTAEKHSKFDSLKQKQSELATKKIELKAIESEISYGEAKLNQDKISAQGKASFLGQEMAEAEKAGNQLNEERKRMAGIEESLAKKDYATGEQEMLLQIENQLTKINYDPQQHDQTRQCLINLEKYENSKRKLEEADRLIHQEKETVVKAEQALQELDYSLEVDNKKKPELLAELSLLPQLEYDVAQVESEHQRLSMEQKQAQEIVGSIKGKLERCFELETKKKEREKQLSQAAKEEQIYQDLAQAFGKKGVQALLIEMALPEIENEANRLLARMTDNRMHVKIETQRETKRGDLSETLDINISDDLGIRDYEMYSGGEAFRINFAIRIALSKLLAKRAGAPLPTLIIDEGFGTQDNTGLEKIKEAITSIQDDFDKILVITHIEELRDAFPVRIEVSKTAEGSIFKVS